MRVRKKTVEISKKYPKKKNFHEEKASSFCEIMREKNRVEKKMFHNIQQIFLDNH